MGDQIDNVIFILIDLGLLQPSAASVQPPAASVQSGQLESSDMGIIEALLQDVCYVCHSCIQTESFTYISSRGR